MDRTGRRVPASPVEAAHRTTTSKSGRRGRRRTRHAVLHRWPPPTPSAPRRDAVLARAAPVHFTRAGCPAGSLFDEMPKRDKTRSLVSADAALAAKLAALLVPKAVQKDEMFGNVVEAALDFRDVQEWEEDVWRAAFKSKDKFYGSSSRVPAMTLSKKAKQSSTFDHKNGTTGLRSSIEAKKRFSYLVASKRKCACKKSAAALNIMDGSTVASAEKHKGMASGQSSSDCSAKKSYRGQEAPRGSKSGSPLRLRNPSWSQLCGSINRMFVAFPLRPGINGIVNQYEFSKHRPGM
uniref:Uncharacterized protein n=1 Tax=Oryza meridionalis TaxID=40149 RepID=A0A0E0F9N6_9ORYZ